MPAALSLLYVPCKTVEEGAFIARVLLKDRLIACANLIPSSFSLYRWEGVIQENQEALMIVKTLPTLVAQISLRIKSLHSYDCPLIVEIPVFAVHPDIFSWVRESVIELD